jgi:hypothetical protein
MKYGNLNFLEPSGPLQTCNGTALPLPLTPTILSLGLHSLSMKCSNYIAYLNCGIPFCTVKGKVHPRTDRESSTKSMYIVVCMFSILPIGKYFNVPTTLCEGAVNSIQ